MLIFFNYIVFFKKGYVFQGCALLVFILDNSKAHFNTFNEPFTQLSVWYSLAILHVIVPFLQEKEYPSNLLLPKKTLNFLWTHSWALEIED